MLRTTIYILELEHGRYYVGKTDNVGKRFHEHMTGKGSSWTRKYKPVSIEKSIPNCSPFDEDKYVKECMAKYGIKNVRGGSYISDELNDFQIDSLKKEIWNAKNCCLRCGHNNHFVKDCFASTDIDGDEIYEIVYCCDTCDREFIFAKDCEQHELTCRRPKQRQVQGCYKCGKPGHYANTCYSNRNNGLLSARSSHNKTANDATLALRLQMHEWALS